MAFQFLIVVIILWTIYPGFMCQTDVSCSQPFIFNRNKQYLEQKAKKVYYNKDTWIFKIGTEEIGITECCLFFFYHVTQKMYDINY